MEGGVVSMSSVIDNRVVKMTFDNAQFEEGIRQTMEILAKFEKSLSFENAGEGFESLNKAADKVDLSSLSNKVSTEVGKIDQYSAEASKSLDKIDDSVSDADFSPLAKAATTAATQIEEAISQIDMSGLSDGANEAGRSFDAMAEISIGALRRIGDEITGGLKSKLSGLKDSIITPIKEGFGEYETQIGAIQTILANTGMSFDSPEDIQLVNDKLDELNEFADKTIYKFTDMVSAIGRFTASGLDIDQATQSVQGVANVAALAGASMQDVSRVLPQISQALSSGSVSMQDWFSMETAHMDSKIFVDTIADVAMHMAEVGKAEQKAYEAGDAILNQGLKMRSALNKTDNKDWAGWFTSDILANALQVFTYDWESMTEQEMQEARKFLQSIGYTTETEINAMFDKANMAQRASTEVRTFSQLMDTLGESVGSNWTTMWRNFIGDFKQATDTFTLLSTTLTGGIDSLFSGINHLADLFNNHNDLEGLESIPTGIELIFGKTITTIDGSAGELEKSSERIKGALDYILEAVSKPLSAIGEAFNAVFGADDQTIVLAIAAVAEGIKNFAESLVISDSAAQSLKDIFQGLFSIVDLALQTIVAAGQGIATVIETVRTVTDPLIDIVLSVFAQAGKLVTWLHDKLVEVMSALGTTFSPLEEGRQVVMDVVTEFFKWADIPGKINAVGDGLIAILDYLWDLVDLPGKIAGLSDIFGGIAQAIGDFTGWNSAVEESNRIFEETGVQVSALDIWFKNLLENPIISFFAGIVEALSQPITSLKEFITGLTEASETSEKSELPSFFDNLKSKAEVLSKPFSKLVDAVKNFGGAVGTFAGKVGTAITKFDPFVKAGEKVSKFFTDLPGKLGKVGESIAGEIGKIQNPLDLFADWLNEKAEYLKTVTVEQFITDVKTSISGFVTGISSTIESLKHMTPETLFNGWSTFIDGFAQNNEGFIQSINNIAQTIETQFPAMSGVLTGAISGIQEGTSGFTSKIEEIKQSLENFGPDDFLDKWDGLKDSLSGVLENIFPDLSTKVEEAMTKFSEFFEKVTEGSETWKEAFDKILEAVKEKITKLPETFTEIFNKIGSGLTKILAFITAQLGKLPGGIGEFFTELSNSFQSAENVDIDGDSLKDSLMAYSDMSNMDINDRLAKGLNENIDIAGVIQNWVNEQMEKIPGIFSEFLEWAKGLFEGTTLDDIVEAVKGLAIARLILSMKSIIKAIAGGISDITGGVGELIKGTSKSVTKIGTSIGDVIKGVGGIEESIAFAIKEQNKRDVFGQLSEAMKNIAIAIGITTASLYVISKIENVQEAISALGELALVLAALETLSGLVTKFLGGGAGDQLLAAAKSIGVMAIDMIAAMGAIALLNQFDWEGNKTGLIAGASMMAAFGAFIIAVTKWGGNGGKQAVEASIAIAVLVGGLNLLLPAIQSLSDYVYGKIEGLEGDKLSKEIGSLVGACAAIIGVMLAMAWALNKAGEHGISAGIGFALVAQGVTTLAAPIETMSKLDLAGMAVAFGGIIVLLGEFAYMTAKLEAADLVGTSVGILAFSYSISMMAHAIEPLIKQNWEEVASLGVAGLAIAGILGVFGVIVAKTNALDLAGSAVGIAIFGAAVLELSAGLNHLGGLDSESLIRAAEAIFITVGALTVLTGWSEALDVIATSTGLIIFGAAIIELTMSLAALSTMDSEGLIRASEAIFITIGALTALTGWTEAGDVLVSSGSMLMFGAAVIELAGALVILSEVPSDQLMYSTVALSALTLALGGLTAITKEGDVLITSTAMLIYGGAIVNMSEALSKLANVEWTQIGAATIALGALTGALGALTKWTDGFDVVGTSAGMLLYAEALVHISNSIHQLAEQPWDQVAAATLALGGLVAVFGILSGATNEVDLIATAVALDLFAAAVFGLAAAISMLPSGEELKSIGVNLIGGIGEGIADGARALTKGFLDCLGMLVQAVKDFFGIHSPSTLMQEEIGQFLPAGIAEGITGNQDVLNTALDGLGEGVLSWVETDGLGMLGSATGSITDWLATDGKQNINKSLSSVSTGVVDWIKADGINNLATAAKALTDWLTTDGVDVIVDFGTYAGKKIMELKDRFLKWFETDGIKMLSDAANGLWEWIVTDGADYFLKFMGWLGEKGLDLIGRVLHWVSTDGIKMLGDALGKLGNWFVTEGLPALQQIGVDIINGIISGIMSMGDFLGQALNDVTGGAFGEVCEFLGIHSPSKLMHDEVGINLVKGIVEGIVDGTDLMNEATSGLGETALEGLKSFFGIHSPSDVMRDEVGINLVAGIAEGMTSMDAEKLMQKAENKLSFEIENAVPGMLNNDNVKQQISKDLDGLASACEKDKTISDVIETVGKFFPEKIANAILRSPAFYVENATPQYLDQLHQSLGILAMKGLGVVDEVALDAEGKLNPILKASMDTMNASVNRYLDEQGLMITSDFKLKARETAANISNEVKNDPEIKKYSGNLLEGIIEGIDLSKAEVTIHGARNRLRTIIKEALPGVLDNEEVKNEIENEFNGIWNAIKQDATINDIIKTVGEYFPENIANAILKSPAFYVQNGTSEYLNHLRDTVTDLATSGYSVIDETMAADKGQLDNLMYSALEYTNISMSNYLERTGQTITENFELQSEAMADGAYKAGWKIPEAFTTAIGDGLGVFKVSPSDLVGSAMQATGASYAYSIDRSTEAFGKLFNTDGNHTWMDDAASILSLAAEYLPKTFADEFQKHSDENVPVLRRALQSLLTSTLPMLDDQGAEYVTSVHSASEIVNEALEYGFYSSIQECINNNNSTIEELSKAIGRIFPENIANGILEHSNLPVTQVAQIADLIGAAMEASVEENNPKYVETLTGAYSYIVDSFFYEIDNAKDVQELGEIIGRYFPEGMGTGIVENRDVPMSEMIENLKWMAMNGQLEIPGFEQTGEQLGLALSDGVVVGLFQDTGWQDNTNGYLTDYANNIKQNTDVFHAAGGSIGMSIDTGSIQAFSEGKFTQEVLDGVANISNLASVPAADSGTAVGESVGQSMVSGTDTGLVGLEETITDSVDDTDSEAVESGADVGGDIGEAIIDGMNNKLNDKDNGIISSIKTIGDEIVDQAGKLGTAIANAIINGVGDGLKGSGDDSFASVFNKESKNIFGQLAGSYKGGSINTSGLLKKDDLEVLKGYDFKTKIVNVESGSKSVLESILESKLQPSVNLVNSGNKSNIDSGVITLSNLMDIKNKATLEEKIGAGVEANKTNIRDLLSEGNYSQTLTQIDTTLSTISAKQQDIYDDFLKELSDIKTKQEDLYDMINTTTNDHLSNIESTVGKDMEIYMDTGALVGAISSDMDEALGYRQILSDRGV